MCLKINMLAGVGTSLHSSKPNHRESADSNRMGDAATEALSTSPLPSRFLGWVHNRMIPFHRGITVDTLLISQPHPPCDTIRV